MCTMHVNIIRSQCTRVPRSGEEANLSSPVSSHVHRESPSTLRRCTSPSLSLSLSLSALLPGSIGLLLMCLLTSVRRLGVADARNQSRPELGERAAQSPLLRGKVVSATLGVGGRKRCSFTLDLSVCPSAKMISELGVMYRHASQAIRQTGRAGGRGGPIIPLRGGAPPPPFIVHERILLFGQSHSHEARDARSPVKTREGGREERDAPQSRPTIAPTVRTTTD